MMIDIDHFKIFNDTHGHKAGDVVLQALGELLRRNIRGEDIACRYGGEEFLLILPDANLGVTKARADALLSQIRKLKIPYQDAIFQVTVSIGVSAFSEASDIQEVINAADKALYQAKKQGRNQVVVALL
jgi:diguanylate cyclase (GGDEF)-like protein